MAGMPDAPPAAPRDDAWIDDVCSYDRFSHALDQMRMDCGVGSDGFSAYLLRKAPEAERKAYWRALQGCVRERRFPGAWKEVLALLVMKPGEDPRELGRRRDI